MHEQKSTEQQGVLIRGAAAVVFPLAIFVAACLTFLIEPLVGKLFLPLLGGSPNVWNTCVLFFQTVLLAGYLYAHVLSSRLSSRWQVGIHLFVVWLPAFTLPFQKPGAVPWKDHPIMWLLSSLLAIAGSVFFATTTTNPLLQKWYSNSRFLLSRDPYFLYAASNAGSFIGLLSYPFWIEPAASIAQQTQLVTTIYFVYAVTVSLSSLLLLKGQASQPDGARNSTSEPTNNTVATSESVESRPGSIANSNSKDDQTESFQAPDVELSSKRPDVTHYARWLMLTALPSSLMLGITTYITQELSSFPLAWILPLAIYLISFIVAFSRVPDSLLRGVARTSPLFVFVTLTLICSDTAIIRTSTVGSSVNFGISIHLLTLLILCIACHGILAIERLAPAFLTQYYLTISIGGVLGSAFNTLLAPVAFVEWLEYPLVLSATGIVLSQWPLLPGASKLERNNYSPEMMKGMCVVIPLAMLLVSILDDRIKYSFFVAQRTKTSLVNELCVDFIFQLLIPIVVCLLLSRNVTHLRLGLSAVAACLLFRFSAGDPRIVHESRNFFGCMKVSINRVSNCCNLWHGATVHGSESLSPHRRGIPLTYYTNDGPIGEVMAEIVNAPGESKPAEFALIGLGCGSLAAYSGRNRGVSIYEIDPAVIQIANNPFYFTYLFQAKQRGARISTEQGDGRLGISQARDGSFRLIAVDAFSSDSIPTHLITIEALKLYLQKLQPDGVLALHISNKYFDLRPVVASAAAELGLPALLKRTKSKITGYLSVWVMLPKSKEDRETLLKKGWQKLETPSNFRLWTDDYSSPLTVLMAPLT
ncbi:MAG: fused MFS/spermidine synthase [Cyanobacteria bacterium]|nr:fused MFS/spermidine synthase [Cyanobacteriota bacterium]